VQDGKNALHRAAEEGQVAAAELLLSHGFDIESRTKKGAWRRWVTDSRHCWCEHGGSRCLAHAHCWLPPLIRPRRCAGLTPFHFAVFKGHRELAEALLRHGANAHTADSTGACWPIH
jgi:hypothetical protein